VSSVVRFVDVWRNDETQSLVYDILHYPKGERSSLLEPFASVVPDCQYFHSQTRALRQRSARQYAAFFRDDGVDGERLPVLVRVPDLHSIEASYSGLLKSLSNSDLQLEGIEDNYAEQIFVDRLSEFLAVQSTSSVPPTPVTIVNSNRGGDTVIYAKGYFASTGTAFGVSTPTKGYLSKGRYSFGIMDSGTPRFANIVWSCPATVRLDLP